MKGVLLLKNKEIIASSQVKRQVLHLIQLESMIEFGYNEYQRYYEEVLKTIENVSYTQLVVAKSMLEFTLSTKRGMMSQIEKEVYLKSIEKIDEIKKEQFLTPKELCSK